MEEETVENGKSEEDNQLLNKNNSGEPISKEKSSDLDDLWFFSLLLNIKYEGRLGKNGRILYQVFTYFQNMQLWYLLWKLGFYKRFFNRWVSFITFYFRKCDWSALIIWLIC